MKTQANRLSIADLIAELQPRIDSLSDYQAALVLSRLVENLRSQCSVPYRNHLPKGDIYRAIKSAVETK